MTSEDMIVGVERIENSLLLTVSDQQLEMGFLLPYQNKSPILFGHPELKGVTQIMSL